MKEHLKSLDEIAISFDTDQATVHTKSYNPHGYTVHMEPLFAPMRDKPIKLLEIGTGGGESIRTWLEYFSEAQIFSVDLVKDTNIFNSSGKPYPRYTFSHGDQTDRTMWKCFLSNCGSDWDVILDDGGHCNDQIITSFEELWPYVKSGGLYIVEDLGVGSTPGTVFVKPGFPNHMDWIRDRMVELNSGQNDIESINLTKELAVFRKK